MKALVTGFDAFGGEKINPSSMAVGRLKRRMGSLMVSLVGLGGCSSLLEKRRNSLPSASRKLNATSSSAPGALLSQ